MYVCMLFDSTLRSDVRDIVSYSFIPLRIQILGMSLRQWGFLFYRNWFSLCGVSAGCVDVFLYRNYFLEVFSWSLLIFFALQVPVEDFFVGCPPKTNSSPDPSYVIVISMYLSIYLRVLFPITLQHLHKAIQLLPAHQHLSARSISDVKNMIQLLCPLWRCCWAISLFLCWFLVFSWTGSGSGSQRRVRRNIRKWH